MAPFNLFLDSGFNGILWLFSLPPSKGFARAFSRSPFFPILVGSICGFFKVSKIGTQFGPNYFPRWENVPIEQLKILVLRKAFGAGHSPL